MTSPVDCQPLERFFELAAMRGITGLDPDDFKWMGCRISPAGVQVQLYKHADTRRHLNLDAGGHSYRWRRLDDTYQLTPLAPVVAEFVQGMPSVAAEIAALWTTTAAAPVAPIMAQPSPEMSL